MVKLPSIYVIMSEKDGKHTPYNGVVWKKYYGTKPRLRTYKNYKNAKNQMDEYQKSYDQAAKYKEEHGTPKWQTNAELVNPGRLYIVEYKAVEDGVS